MGVFDGEIALDVVDERQRQQQRGNHVEAAAHVIDFVDLGQRRDGFDGETAASICMASNKAMSSAERREI
jgi:hypothetical protein